MGVVSLRDNDKRKICICSSEVFFSPSIFDPQFVESMDAKLTNMEDQLFMVNDSKTSNILIIISKDRYLTNI